LAWLQGRDPRTVCQLFLDREADLQHLSVDLRGFLTHGMIGLPSAITALGRRREFDIKIA
jgi:hypothetical protein